MKNSFEAKMENMINGYHACVTDRIEELAEEQRNYADWDVDILEEIARSTGYEDLFDDDEISEHFQYAENIADFLEEQLNIELY